MFQSVFAKTLRDNRIPILGFGLGLGLFLLNSFVSYATQVTGAAARREVAQLAEAFRFLGDPVALDTNEGLITWRIMSFLVPLILCIWAVRAGANLVRDEEESGRLDVLLAAPLGRVRLLVEKILALLAGLILAGLLFGACGVLGQVLGGLQLNVRTAIMAGLNVSLLGAFFATLALLLSQVLPSRRAALAWSGGLMVISALADGIGRAAPGAAIVQRLSAFYYYNLNKPLIPAYPANGGAVLLLAGLAAALAAASVIVFQRRDLSTGVGALVGKRRGGVEKDTDRQPATSRTAGAQPRAVWSLRSAGARAVHAHLASLAGWLIGLAVYTGGAVLLMPAMKQAAGVVFDQVAMFDIFFPGVDFSSDAGFYSVIVIEFLPLIVLFFALAFSLSWASDLDDRELETVWAAPVPRLRFYGQRLLATALGLLAVPAVIWLAIQVCARLVGVDFGSRPGLIEAATLGLLPLELLVAGLVYLLSGYLRSNHVLLPVAGYLVLAFLLVLVNDYFALPGWLMALSIIHDYGLVMEHGYAWAGVYLPMAAAGAGLLVWGAARFRQRDLGV